MGISGYVCGVGKPTDGAARDLRVIMVNEHACYNDLVAHDSKEALYYLESGSSQQTRAAFAAVN